jgi:hypothetical protein
MVEGADHLPDDIAALKVALIETRAKLSGAQALIEHLQLVIAKMKRGMFGPRSERSQRLIDQLELQLEELAAVAAEDATKAETARVQVQGFTRRQATRRNFPADLPRPFNGDGHGLYFFDESLQILADRTGRSSRPLAQRYLPCSLLKIVGAIFRAVFGMIIALDFKRSFLVMAERRDTSCKFARSFRLRCWRASEGH